jgi:stearoyl-CoA desaturase (Delta-9 desaturase)
MEYIISAIVFFSAYTLNMFYISVLYHRGLAHGSVKLGPILNTLLKRTGVWITGLDPKTWACMHRIHHLYSDTENDPHSPKRWGVFGVWIGQYRSYLKIQSELLRKNFEYLKVVQDIPFDVSKLFKLNGSWLPYIIHFFTAITIGFTFHSVLIPVAYFLGLMSHPFQGWLVNAFAHRYGRRNFSTNDESTNNTLVGLLVFGEGYQNNHHHYPERAKFSVKWYEFDAGYLLCWLSEKFGLLQIVKKHN